MSTSSKRFTVGDAPEDDEVPMEELDFELDRLEEVDEKRSAWNRLFGRKFTGKTLFFVIAPTIMVIVFIVLIVVASQRPSRNSYTPPDISIDHLINASTEEVKNDLAFLSSDMFQGRGTGSSGEALAVAFIANEMAQYGLTPLSPETATDDKFFAQSIQPYIHKVPLLGSKTLANPAPLFAFGESNDDPKNFTWIEDFTIWTDTDRDYISVQEERIIFVGFGITAPEWNWDNYKNVDVQGKVIMCFVNDPGHFNSSIFEGNTLTYYGRWTYKIEEARRRGAKGLILIHTDDTAGYPFSVLQHSGEQVSFGVDSPLELISWITKSTLDAILDLAHMSYDQLVTESMANPNYFKILPDFFSINFHAEARRFNGYNTAGAFRGTKRADEYVLVTAHHDHLGIGLPDNTGDTIYNGALDNAAGVSALLSLLRTFARASNTSLANPSRVNSISFDRSILFVTVTAEEKGLVGSDFMARNPFPQVPNSAIVANINFDGCNIFGKTSDIVGIGAEKSTLEQLFANAADRAGLTVSADPHPEQGSYFRSDQLSYARVGIPGVLIGDGSHFIGQPDNYADQVFQEYNEYHYHQPSDEFNSAWDLGGCTQQMRVAAFLADNLLNSDVWPEWKPDSGFHR